MTKLLLTIIISNALFSFVLLGQQSNSRYKEEEKEYLFPGTGFFVKNRKPYENNEAINWFREAYSLELKGEYGKALSLYEKFSKRRSDALVKIDSKQFKVGPEALFRAARIRETRGDWSKSFDLLRLIAQAYSDYEFDIVASSLMRVAERLANEKLPKKWGLVPRFRSGSQDRMRLNQIAGLAKGPKFAPRALMTLAEISIKDENNYDGNFLVTERNDNNDGFNYSSYANTFNPPGDIEVSNENKRKRDNDKNKQSSTTKKVKYSFRNVTIRKNK